MADWTAKLLKAEVDPKRGVGNVYCEVELRKGDYVEIVNGVADDLDVTLPDYLGRIVASREKRDAALAKLKAMEGQEVEIRLPVEKKPE